MFGAITSTLRRGSSGAQVYELQKKLTDLGYYDGALSGTFDGPTFEAVEMFQEVYNLAVDGIVGRNTRAKLKIAVPGDIIVSDAAGTRVIGPKGPSVLTKISKQLKIPVPLIITTGAVLSIAAVMLFIKPKKKSSTMTPAMANPNS